MKTTLTAAVAIAILALGLIVFRNIMVKQKDACEVRLTTIGTSLANYAHKHRGRLPMFKDDLNEILSSDSDQYASALELDVKTTFYWDIGNALPYLWDRNPHAFVGGVHVLFTDGHVETLATAPTKDDF